MTFNNHYKEISFDIAVFLKMFSNLSAELKFCFLHGIIPFYNSRSWETTAMLKLSDVSLAAFAVKCSHIEGRSVRIVI